MSEKHRIFRRFRPFSGQTEAGSEAWFYGVMIRDWLFTGTSKNLPGGPVSVGHPPVDYEFFKWLALMAGILSADRSFTMVECGAGWGRWLAAAAQLARQRELPFRVLGAEGDPCHFDWMQMVLRDNGVLPEQQHLEYAVVAPKPGKVQFLTSDQPATFYGQRIVTRAEALRLGEDTHFRCGQRIAVTLSSILAQVDRADLVSIDIGRFEEQVVASALEPLREKARLLQINTRSRESHQLLEAKLAREGWRLVYSFPPGQGSDTFAGPVHFDQGLQVWVGPEQQSAADLFAPGNAYPVGSVSEAVSLNPARAIDTEAAAAIDQARLLHLASLGLPLDGRKVLDAGCGVGNLAGFFVDRGCAVTCVDVRPENISRLRKIYPGLEAHVLNVENEALSRLGRFEVVFGYGLLHHLENPAAALRNLASVCDDLLLLETVVADYDEPLAGLVDAPESGALGARPTPAFVALALNRAGFSYVYGPLQPPDHPDFQFTWKNDLKWSRDGHSLRCVFVASRTELDHPTLDLLIGKGPKSTAPVVSVKKEPRVWVDVGAGLGDQTFAAAGNDPHLRVYAFEPDLELAARSAGQLSNYLTLPLAVGRENGAATLFRNADRAASSLWPFHAEGPALWKGALTLSVEEECPVPVTRLDTFLKGMGVSEVDYLKIDAPGAALAAIQSAGDRLAGVHKISLVVQTTTVPLYADAPTAAEIVPWLRDAGFGLVSIEERSYGQEEILTFVRDRDLSLDEDGSRLARGRELASFRPLDPEPGWKFDKDWNSHDPVIRERRQIWEHFQFRGYAGPLTVEWLDGIRLTLYLGNDLSRQIFCLGRFEPNEFAWLSRFLKPGMCFVDAGANEGVYTLFAASRVGAEGKVWAFEPSPREFARLTANCAQNRFDNVSLFRGALSSKNGTAWLSIVDGDHAGQNMLQQPEALPVLRRELVPVDRFDDVAAREHLSRLDVFKIDVEGEEFRLLTGAERSIRQFRPVILFECSDRLLKGRGSDASQLKQLLSDWGYRIHGFNPVTGLPVPDYSADDTNLLAIAP